MTGTSLGVSLPPLFLELIDLKDGDYVDIRYKAGKIIMEASK